MATLQSIQGFSHISSVMIVKCKYVIYTVQLQTSLISDALKCINPVAYNMRQNTDLHLKGYLITKTKKTGQRCAKRVKDAIIDTQLSMTLSTESISCSPFPYHRHAVGKQPNEVWPASSV